MNGFETLDQALNFARDLLRANGFVAIPAGQPETAGEFCGMTVGAMGSIGRRSKVCVLAWPTSTLLTNTSRPMTVTSSPGRPTTRLKNGCAKINEGRESHDILSHFWIMKKTTVKGLYLWSIHISYWNRTGRPRCRLWITTHRNSLSDALSKANTFLARNMEEYPDPRILGGKAKGTLDA